MNDNIKNKVVTGIFFVFILGFFFMNIATPSVAISKSERRELAQFPMLNFATVMSTEFMNNFEKFTLDQFPFREEFRTIKAKVLFHLFNQKDNNQIYIVDGQVSKYSREINEVAVKDAAKKFNKLNNQFLKDMNVYYSVIPDKNYYMASKNGYPSIDYDKFIKILNDNIQDIEYIDIFSTLSEKDYYATDTHWKQENLGKVIETLGNKMKVDFADISEYEQKTLEPFYGVYYGQSALSLEPDKLVYLTNDIIENVKLRKLIVNKENNDLEWIDSKIYDANEFNNDDPYDLFLSGPEMLIEIVNDKATTDKELIIFRDSFGSSLSPLLVSAYKKVVVVDLRHIASPLLSRFVEFKAGSDVLIINSVDVLNNSSTIKVL